MAFGGVFTIQGEEEFSLVSCGRVLISLTLHLIHAVSISPSPLPPLCSHLLVLLQTVHLLTRQTKPVK